MHNFLCASISFSIHPLEMLNPTEHRMEYTHWWHCVRYYEFMMLNDNDDGSGNGSGSGSGDKVPNVCVWISHVLWSCHIPFLHAQEKLRGATIMYNATTMTTNENFLPFLSASIWWCCARYADSVTDTEYVLLMFYVSVEFTAIPLANAQWNCHQSSSDNFDFGTILIAKIFRFFIWLTLAAIPPRLISK